MQAYLDKGRVRTLLGTVPLFAVLTEDLGVRGVYKCAMMVSLRVLETIQCERILMYVRLEMLGSVLSVLILKTLCRFVVNRITKEFAVKLMNRH